MQTLKHSNQTHKRILIFGTLAAILLALTCSFSWPTSAQGSMDDEMDDEMGMNMMQIFRPFATEEELARSLPLADPSSDPCSASHDPCWETHDVPSAGATVVNDINNSGKMVGAYSVGLAVHGFVYDPVTGQHESIDYQNAKCTAGTTDVRGVNERGDIVGACTDSAVNFYGYLRTAEGFTPISASGHTSTIAQGISNDDIVVGCIHDTNMTTTMFGMTWQSDNFDFFGGMFGGLTGRGFMNNGISRGGSLVVGFFTDTTITPAKPRSYIVQDGAVTVFDYPNATATNAWGVNAQGDVVGVWREGANTFHGFVRSSRGEFKSIDFPGATLTRAFGINNNGDIVGTYVLGGKQHGFVRSTRGRGNLSP